MRRRFLPRLVASSILVPLAGAQAADLAPIRQARSQATSQAMSYAAPAVLPHEWTGFYLGGQAGYGFGSSDGTQNAGGTFFPVVPYTIDPRGFLGGGHTGFNYQLGALVLGVEGDIEAADVSGLTSINAFGQTYFFNVKTDMLASVRGRTGYAWNNWLFYATGGVAWGHVETPPLSSLDGTRTGWTAGAGIEFAIDPKWSARIEYRYTDLGRASAAGGEPASVDDNALDFHAFRVGVSYKLGAWRR